MLRGLHLNDKTKPKTQMANESASLRACGNNPVQREKGGAGAGGGALPAFTARGFLSAAGREAGLVDRQVGSGGGRGSVSAGCFLADALRSARMIGKQGNVGM